MLKTLIHNLQNCHSKTLIFEIFLLFGLLPLTLLLLFPSWLIATLVATGVLYTIGMCIKYGYFSRAILTSLAIQGHHYLVLRWAVFVVIATILFYVSAPDAFLH